MKQLRSLLVLIVLVSSACCTGSRQCLPPETAGDITAVPADREEYLLARKALIEADDQLRFDADLPLTPDEEIVNTYLVDLRDRAIDRARKTGFFPPARYFYEGKQEIESSELFRILRRMPKGAVLHIHTGSAGSADWIVEQAALRADCYVYWSEDTGSRIKGELAFFNAGSEPAGFQPVNELRRQVPDFDRQLFEMITFGEEDSDSPDIWKEFERCFSRLEGFLNYQPVFMDYYTDAGRIMLEDNVQHLELRAGLDPLYDLNGKTWSGPEVIELYREIRDRVRQEDPAFGLKLIACHHRFAGVREILKDLEEVVKMRAAAPDLLIGYDLVGEEDTGHTTLYYLDAWLALPALCEKYGTDLPLYFHDGESDWRGDVNLYDAYLLRCRRIGHGFNLFNFPLLERRITEQGIPLEVCPISNQVLHYIRDLRLHPANGYLARGVPCVISSDDPGIFGYQGLSYDFWEAFMAWNLDLRDLKKLALNSIIYSGMNPEEKQSALKVWRRRWTRFISSMTEEIEAGSVFIKLD